MATAQQFTSLAQEHLLASQKLAEKDGNISCTPLHILAIFVQPQEQGDNAQTTQTTELVHRILPANAVEVIKKETGKALVRLPRQDPKPDNFETTPNNAWTKVVKKVSHTQYAIQRQRFLKLCG